MNKLWFPLGLLLSLMPGCNKTETPPSPPSPTASPTAEVPPKPVEKPAPTAAPVGMLNPFPHLSDQAAKSYNNAWAQMKAKKYEEAAGSFSEVVTALPDYLNARFQAARAYLLASNSTATRQQLEELLSRNFVAYGGRAGSAKEFALFRTSPEWPAYEQAEARWKTAYAQGLEHGLVLVARSGSVDAPSFAPGKAAGQSEAKLELKQEAYHFDPESNRYRPLTATDGRVLAALRSADGRRLAFLVVERVQKDDKKTWFYEPEFGFVNLSTLETAGPIKLGGGHEELSIGFGATGTPLVATTGALAAAGEGLGAGTYEVDTARTGLAKATSDPEIKGNRIVARYDRLWHADRPGPAEVVLSEDRHSVKLGDSGVITSARALSESSLAFSPGQRFFVYAGQLDACAAQRDDKSKAAQNELFVYEVEKKSATRIDTGPSAFDSVWLGDYLLAYENSVPAATSTGKGQDSSGPGGKTTIDLYDLAAHKKTALPFLRYGAGFYGLSSFYCPAPAPAAIPPAPAPAAAPATPAAQPTSY